MNKLRIFKKTAISLSSLATALLLTSSVALAIPYTGPSTPPSPVPAFNVFTGAPAPDSNEADFFTGRVPINGDDSDATTKYSDPLNASCANGQKIQMRIYVHNGASQDANNGGSGPSVAHGVNVKVNLDNAQAASTFNPNATISATNAATVNNGLTINCNGKTVKLKFIHDSAQAYSLGTGVYPLSDDIVGSGVAIRSQSVPGDVWGCWDERVYVVLNVEVEEIPDQKIPFYECSVLTLAYDINNRRHVTATTVAKAGNGATITGIKTDFGDGTIVDANAQGVAEHTYSASVNRTVKSTVSVHLPNNTDVTATSPDCAKPVSFTTPPPSGKLPNTGPGEFLGATFGTGALGASVRSWFRSKRSLKRALLKG